eukprot:6694080-Pyramimonas_sp.AAC.1
MDPIDEFGTKFKVFRVELASVVASTANAAAGKAVDPVMSAIKALEEAAKSDANTRKAHVEA